VISDFSTRTRTDKAYRLYRDIDYLGKDEATEEGAWLINYPNPPDQGMFWRITDSLNLPKRIEFEVIGSLLEKTDYPLTDVRWPIMSQQMLNTLLSVGSFSHRAYPVVMLDVVEAYDPKLKKYIVPRTENYNYVAVHLTEHLDVFNFEDSVYERGKINPNVIVGVEWLVLKELKNGFPPLFALDDSPLDLFVSAEARVALEAANVQGIRFLHVEDGTPV
jgi:hypothetical protein